jgi:16S rRNA (cytosine1402-N4)-methyltransferase
MSEATTYHVPVMLNECIEGLNIKPNGIYVDVTFGGGGHSAAIVKHLTTGKLYGFDQDDDASKNAQSFDKQRFTLVEANFRHLKRYLKLHGVTRIDGLLADLGVSSHQIDAPERGFSTRFDGPLDMRMNQNDELTAAKVINTYSEEKLHRIFGIYGEVKNAKTLAALVFKSRLQNPIETIEQFKRVTQPVAPRGKENKYYAQVFQALRIEVNQELEALQEMIVQATEMLKPQGRLVVMAYHSLEDRLVKNYIAKGKFFGEVEKDLYGNEQKPLQSLLRKPIEASEEEIEQNRRARSAKLRIAEKL